MRRLQNPQMADYGHTLTIDAQLQQLVTHLLKHPIKEPEDNSTLQGCCPSHNKTVHEELRQIQQCDGRNTSPKPVPLGHHPQEQNPAAGGLKKTADQCTAHTAAKAIRIDRPQDLCRDENHDAKQEKADQFGEKKQGHNRFIAYEKWAASYAQAARSAPSKAQSVRATSSAVCAVDKKPTS